MNQKEKESSIREFLYRTLIICIVHLTQRNFYSHCLVEYKDLLAIMFFFSEIRMRVEKHGKQRMEGWISVVVEVEREKKKKAFGSG
jgi:hypothetical protein